MIPFSPSISRNPSPQINPLVEEEESELEEEDYESEEEEEGEWSDTESEALPPFRELLSDEIITPIRMRLEEVAARDDDFDEEITNEHIRSYMLDAACKNGVKTIREFNALDWKSIFSSDYDCGDEPAVDEPAAIVDSYDEVSGTELVRTGDIIKVRAADPSRAGQFNKVHSSEHSMGTEVIINTENPSPDTFEDVAHDTEITETSKDAARDELFIKTGEDA